MGSRDSPTNHGVYLVMIPLGHMIQFGLRPKMSTKKNDTHSDTLKPTEPAHLTSLLELIHYAERRMQYMVHGK